MDSEDATGYMSIVIAKSLEPKAKAIFGYLPEYRISPYNTAVTDLKTGAITPDLRYQILLKLKPERYIYWQDIRQLNMIGVEVSGMRSERDGTLSVYLELSLDRYLVETKEQLMLKPTGSKPPQTDTASSHQRAL